MQKILVLAKAGTVCPMPGGRGAVTDAKPVEVPDTLHYRTLIRQGALVRVQEKKKKAAARPQEGGKRR